MSIQFEDYVNLDGPEFVDGLFAHAEELALEQLETITEEQGVEMFREFTGVIMDWHPIIAKLAQNDEDPISVVLGTMMVVSMYRHLFRRCYDFSSRKLQAEESIRKAFENS